MDDLLFARAQMAVSLGFHIVFAVAGIGMLLFCLTFSSTGGEPVTIGSQ